MKMSIKKKLTGTGMEKLSNFGFYIMLLMYRVYDLFFDSEKRIDEHVKSIGIKEGSTVVDYGCGPGRYIFRFSKLVGDNGHLYACDIHEMAIKIVNEKIRENNLKNVEPVLTHGYSCSIKNQSADTICALDMFHFIKEPTLFLMELHRIVKKSGILIINDGHQSRELTKTKILNSNLWTIFKEEEDLLKCYPL